MGEIEAIDTQLKLLMTAAQAGDKDSYRVLLTVIAPRIRRIVHARRAFLGSADVEDLVQDVLLSVHTAMATYNPSRPFTPWPLAIIRHRLVDAARRSGRRSRREIALEDLEVTAAALAANTDENLVGDVEVLAQAIRSLPPGQRQAIELLKLKEMSLKEASKVTGSSVSALKVATHRAMMSLRRVFGISVDHEQ